jgi:hypothetical protein
MGKVYTPPTLIEEEDYVQHMVFLAGSIEMDKAENWQDRLCEKLIKIDNLTILNPRRPNWDSSWEQSIDNPFFVEQVNWELDGIESADTLIFYFDPKTKSPITLLELGMVSQMALGKNIILCCPKGFWRKGNVDIVTERIKKFIIEESDIYPESNALKLVDSKFRVVESLDELIRVTYDFLNKTIHGKN